MFPKSNMSRDTKPFRDRIPMSISFMFNTITQKNNIVENEVQVLIIHEAGEKKTRGPKNTEKTISKNFTIQTFVRRLVTSDCGWNTIDGIDND